MREDGVRLHLFDPVAVKPHARGGAQSRRPRAPSTSASGDTTLIRFIKCSRPPLRQAMYQKIQYALAQVAGGEGA